MAIPQQNIAPVNAGQPAPKFSFGIQQKNRAYAPSARGAYTPTHSSVEVVGLLKSLRMFGKWGVGTVIDRKSGKRVDVKGVGMADLRPGNHYRFAGNMVNHPVYGPGLDVNQVVPDMDNMDALVGLIKRNYKNVGNATAQKMVEYFENTSSVDQLKELLVHDPGAVDFSVVTNRDVTLTDDDGSDVRRISDSLAMRFGDLGISRLTIRNMAGSLLKDLQKNQSGQNLDSRHIVRLANELFASNPYALLNRRDSVSGYSFVMADLIAGKIGIARDDPKRIGALVTYALSNRCSDLGHVYLDQEQLCSAIYGVDSSLDPLSAIRVAMDDNAPIRVVGKKHGTPRYYTDTLYYAEKSLAKHVAQRLTERSDPLVSLEGDALDEAIEAAARHVGAANGIADFQLDDGQMAALRGILTSTSSLHALTGGPGCGKTAIVEVLMRVLKINTPNASKPLFCAPTGKAAKVLGNRIKAHGNAKTIHSTLGMFEEGFKRYHSGNQLETDFVVADEQSMMSLELAADFFAAIPEDAHILLLGDPDQLDPVDVGCPFRSLLTLDALDHYHLVKTHRNRGALLDLVKSVHAGTWPHTYERKQMEQKGGVRFHEMPAPTPEMFVRLAHDIKAAADKYGGLSRVGVLCPKRRGNITTPDWNVTYLNHALRDVLNPDVDGQRKIAGTVFRLNDRIIVSKNMTIHAAKTVRGRYEKDEDKKTYVANGDTGVLIDAAHAHTEDGRELQHLVLHLDDDRQVCFPAENLESLNLSYAITVHAAQGSEYDKVFAFVTKGHDQFMHRALVMTQLSRARQSLSVMGNEEDVAQIVQRPAPVRQCALAERVLFKMKEAESEDCQDGVRSERIRQAA